MLENVPKIRILVGINVDSLIADYQKRGLLFHGAEGETLAQIKASLLKDIEEAEYSPQVEKGNYVDDPKKWDANHFWDTLKGQWRPRTDLVSLIADCSHSLSWVLNPHSHSRPVDHIRREIQQAVDAVAALEIEVAKDIAARRAEATRRASDAEARAVAAIPAPPGAQTPQQVSP
jgi:hypothetical protein